MISPCFGISAPDGGFCGASLSVPPGSDGRHFAGSRRRQFSRLEAWERPISAISERVRCLVQQSATWPFKPSESSESSEFSEFSECTDTGAAARVLLRLKSIAMVPPDLSSPTVLACQPPDFPTVSPVGGSQRPKSQSCKAHEEDRLTTQHGWSHAQESE